VWALMMGGVAFLGMLVSFRASYSATA